MRCAARFFHIKSFIVTKLVFPLISCHLERQIWCWIVAPLTHLPSAPKTGLTQVKTFEVLFTVERQRVKIKDKNSGIVVSASERNFLTVIKLVVHCTVLQLDG